MPNEVNAEVAGRLRASVVAFQQSAMYQQIVQPRDQVLARFQPLFVPDHIPSITADEFKSFLLFENNRHWTGLHRQGTRMCSDMAALRAGLSVLVSEDCPLAERPRPTPWNCLRFYDPGS
jgi:hypothetical protein